MKLNKITKICFSPTGSTKRVLELIEEENLNIEGEFIDVTNYSSEIKEKIYSSDNLIIVGFPVYSGRVPQVFIEKLKEIQGNNTPYVIVGTYGNREYDDAILEMKNLLDNKGFKLVGAVAIVTEHSIVRKIATGRPNEEDIKKIKCFSQELFNKLNSINNVLDENIKVNGNEEYREMKNVPFKPHMTSKCVGCGLCSTSCPVNAISKENLKLVNKEKCISCMRCISICPKKARKLYKYEEFLAKKGIEKKCIEYKNIEVWL